ncbi:MAG: DUF1565 domain-containing protein [Opitutales bacterium]
MRLLPHRPLPRPKYRSSRPRPTHRVAALFLLALLSAAVPLPAATIFVDTDQPISDSYDGSSWSSAYRTLQGALAQATDGDEIWIAEGIYYPNDLEDGSNAFDVTDTFSIPDGVALYGGFGGNENSRGEADPAARPTILDGDLVLERAYHVVTVGDAVLLSGLTIRNGDATDAPEGSNTSGAIFLTDAANSVTLQDMILENNKAWEGAVTAGGNWTVENALFRNNDAANVGGVARGGTWQVDNSLFIGNAADSAGVFFQGSWTVRNSAFRDNTALGPDRSLNWPDDVANRGGGGVASGIGTPAFNLTAVNTEFSGNFADLSGVAGSLSDTAEAYTVNCTNCLFFKNAAFEGGVARGGTWNIVQSVFADNDAITEAGVAVGGKWTVELSTFAKNGVGFNEPRRGRTAVNGPITPASWTIRDSVFADEDFVPVNADLAAEYQLDIEDTGGSPRHNLLSAATFAANEHNLDSLFGASWESIKATYLLAETANSPFADESDPAGTDATWGTADDGLRLREGSPAEDLVDSERLVADILDLDGDHDMAEDLPIDFSIIRALSTDQATSFNRPRALGSATPAYYDLGAYEGTALQLTFTTNLDSASITPSGTIPWAQYYLREVSVTNDAPGGAMVFSGFSLSDPGAGAFIGSATSDGNGTYTHIFLPTASTIITAEYTPDTADEDGDGLTNYDEIAVYGSDPAAADSSGDGIGDGTAVAAGLDPTTSYDAIVADIQSKLIDLRAGSSLITPTTEGILRIELQLERSTDLQTWADGPTITHEVSPAFPNEFYRFRLD